MNLFNCLKTLFFAVLLYVVCNMGGVTARRSLYIHNLKKVVLFEPFLSKCQMIKFP